MSKSSNLHVDSDIFNSPREAPPPIMLITPRLDGVAVSKEVAVRSNKASKIPCSGKPSKTPRWDGFPETIRPYSGLLSTPADASAHNLGLVVDPQLEPIQLALAEHRKELSRVAESFEKRLVTLCQAMCNVTQPSCTSELVTSRQKESSVQMTIKDTVAASEEHESLNSPRDDPHTRMQPDAEKNDLHGSTTIADRASVNSASSPDEVMASPLHNDFQLVRGWMDLGAPKKTVSLRLSSETGNVQGNCLRRGLGRVVNHTAFDAFSCAIIALDTILTGVTADYSARNTDQEVPEVFRSMELAFLIWYSTELLIRFIAEGHRFFFSGWNIFDLTLVSFDMLVKIQAAASGTESAFGGVAAARMFRMLRLFRAFRVIRMLRFLRELRMMAKCIIACSKTVVWVLLLMCMNIYVFAVYLTGQVSAAFREGELTDIASQVIVERRFGTVTDASLSLFMAVSGGISWVEFTDPLIDIHWTNGLVIWLFVFLTTFAMLNIITGVFVDSAVTAGRTDEEELVQDIIDDENSSIKKIRQLFEHVNINGDDHLTFKELEDQVSQPEVRILFKSIGIGVHQIRGLFKLLDLDGSGSVTLDEFITGCMRLRESSYNSIDLSTILYENKRMMLKWKVFYSETKKQFASLHEQISSLQKSISTSYA